AGDRKHHAGFGQDVFVLPGGEDLLVSVVSVGSGFVTGLAQRAVIDEGANRNTVDELRNASGVIDVIVGEQNEVDPREARRVCGLDDAAGIAAIIAWPASVD